MRISALLSVLLMMGCRDSGFTKLNSAPVVTITSHTTDDTVQEGVAEWLRGQVGDAEHPIADLSASWFIDGAEACTESVPDEVGVVSCEATFVPGGGEVTLEVRDPAGAGSSAQVALVVQPTDAPVATITAPNVDGVYYSDQLTTLTATVSDTEDPVDALTVLWESASDGALEGAFDVPDSEGNLLGAVTFTEGEHFLSLTVTDTTGKEGRDSVTINVGPPNSSPSCIITAPETESAGSEGDLVTFLGVVSDPDVPANWLSVAWTSDKDGPIGTSSPDSAGSVLFPYDGLSVNTHVVTMTVTDEIGADCAVNLQYTVGTPPTLTITAPTDGSILNHSDAVVFEATVSDNEDSPDEVSLSWESDIDGVFSAAGADSSGGASVSTIDLSPGDHVVTVTATDTAGLFVSDTVSFNLNEPPTTPTVSLTPDPATTDQVLVASAGGSVDPDESGTVIYAYAWFEDGVPSPESTSGIYPATATAKHHTYRVQVTPGDGLAEGEPAWAEVSVINSDPVLAGPTLSAGTAVVGDVLSCTATATDVDASDTPTITYAWSDGSTGATYVVSATDSVDSDIGCTATANDGDGGIVSATASATVINTAPEMGTVSVSPEDVRVGDTLICSATATDADGDVPTMTYTWSGGGTGETHVVGVADDPGSTIVCTATATDPGGLTATGSASATVSNTDPVMGTVTISPDPATNSDTLTCSATASDADGGSPSFGYTWSTGATGSALPLSSAIAASGDTLSCTATATDAHGGSATGSADITLSNRDPLVSVALSPAAPTKHDTLTCTAVGVSDPDDDTTTVAFTWTVDGTPEAATTSSDTDSTLEGAFVSGQSVTCLAEVSDGKGGTSTATATIEIVNTAPEVLTVSLTPSAAYTNDTLTAVATTTDLDGDSVTVSYAWFVDGSPVGATGSSLSGATYFDKDESVYVVVTPSDGTDSGDSMASDSITISNTAPGAPSVSIDPEDPTAGVDDIVCSIDSDSSDADGDTVYYTITWDVDGTPFTDAITTTWTGDTISTDDMNGDEEWTCTVTPNDGDEDGSTADASVITLLEEGPVVDMASGGYHNCAVLEDESLVCWGSDGDGRSTPPGGSFIDVAAGEYGSCAITTGGSLNCWGRDHHGMLSEPSGTFTQVNSAYWHSCAVKGSGAVRCWGYDAYGQSSPPSGAFEQVVLGAYHSCGVRTSGSISCWGRNNKGQRSSPSGTFSVMAAEHYHNCAVRTTGTLKCWGMNGDGQCSPPAGTFTDVAAGAFHSCGIRTSGELECWGRDDDGQSSPPAGTFVRVEAGSYHSCAISTEGWVECWGRGSATRPPAEIEGL